MGACPPMYVCFPILSVWTLWSTSARIVGGMEISILPSSHVSPPASFLPGLFDACGAIVVGPVSIQDGDLLAQVTYNLLGSSQDPPNYSWVEMANTQYWPGIHPGSANDVVCYVPEAVKSGSTPGHQFVLHIGERLARNLFQIGNY